MDERLKTIARMAGYGKGVADIGCDHGYLICSLIEEKQATFGLACDINKKPLQKASDEINSRHLSEQIRVIQADGLKNVPLKEVDRIVIAGMGGDLITQIIENSLAKENNNITWLLQPMTKSITLREWLGENGLEILEEKCCLAKNKIYSVIKAKQTGKKQNLTVKEKYFGKIDFDNDPFAQMYRQKVLTQLDKQIIEQAKSVNPENKEKTIMLLALKEKLK